MSQPSRRQDLAIAVICCIAMESFATDPTYADCVNSGKSTAFGIHCYFPYGGNNDFNGATTACGAEGSLAVLNNKDLMLHIKNHKAALYSGQGDEKYWWINLKQIPHNTPGNDNWFWTLPDGTTEAAEGVGDTSWGWHPNEPGTSGSQNHAYVLGYGAYGDIDGVSSFEYRALCQFKNPAAVCRQFVEVRGRLLTTAMAEVAAADAQDCAVQCLGTAGCQAFQWDSSTSPPCGLAAEKSDDNGVFSNGSDPTKEVYELD